MNSTGRSNQPIAFAAIALVAISSVSPGWAQSINEFHRTLAVTETEPVLLDVELPHGDIQILYSRDGEVSITGSAQNTSGATVSVDFLGAGLLVEQDANRIRIQQSAGAAELKGIHLTYRVDVPYRTEVTSVVRNGKQTISGIMGPVHAVSIWGDISASYISKKVFAHAETGNLDLRVVGEHADASTGGGSISCTRAMQGVNAETEDGDITLMVVGASTARIKRGSGAIAIGGARGSLLAATDGGSLHVKAEPHGEWQLTSAMGNIRIELPPRAQFVLNAATKSGEITVGRDDLHQPDGDPRHLQQKANGGGSSIQVRTEGGRIVIQ
jgi:hypothetical protein